MSDVPLWEQLPGETKKGYEAFLKYRGIGPQRNLAEACRLVYNGNLNSKNQIKRWAKDFSWKARAEAWDAHLVSLADAAAEEAVQTEAAELEKERVAAARLRVETAQEGVRLVRAWMRMITRPDLLPAGMIPSLLKVCVDLERMEDGEATERVEEIQTWAELMKRAKRG